MKTLVRTIVFLVTMVFSLSMGAPAVFAEMTGPQEVEDKLAPIRKEVQNYLTEGKPVLLYFFSETIQDSREGIDELTRVAREHGAEIVTLEAMDYPVLRYSYNVDFVPTVFSIHPEAGLNGVWIVDLPAEDIVRSLEKDIRPTRAQKKIATGIQDGMPQMLFFMADWCGYCNRIIPQVEKFEKEFSDRVNVVTIDLDEEGQIADPYFVSGVPSILITGPSGLVLRRTGYPAGYAEYKELFNEIGVDLNSGKVSDQNKQ